jgi:tyrosinase
LHQLSFIELCFIFPVRPGQNVLKRESIQSTVTIPFERTFRNLDQRPASGTGETSFNFCGCGWPAHMLVPKGSTQGIQGELFVMISNYEEDRVNQELTGTCNDAASFCGIRDRKYPDTKPMGYPFDRLNRQGADTLRTFLTPNMGVVDVSITFTERTVLPRN